MKTLFITLSLLFAAVAAAQYTQLMKRTRR